mmetsp:Transcript_37062/g.69105  ORF Transcript_37062/g.69105 Transcript_37062/m.69105 type:complete len:315 (-) Transcript_37062:324-1268(-)
MPLSEMMATLRSRGEDLVGFAQESVSSARTKALNSVNSMTTATAETLIVAKKRAEMKMQEALDTFFASKAFVTVRVQEGTAAMTAGYRHLRSGGVRSYAARGLTSLQERALSRYLAARKSIQSVVDATYKTAAAHALAVRSRLAAAGMQAQHRAETAGIAAKAKAVEAYSKVKTVAKDGHVQATTAGVLSGASALGAAGGATGLAAGSAVGAVLGVVPALFTFGLSIPVGAVIGGGTGCAVGATVGAATGAMSGGAAGYGAYARRSEIHQMSKSAVTRVSSGVDLVRSRAVASVDFVKDKASAVRANFAKAKAE